MATPLNSVPARAGNEPATPPRARRASFSWRHVAPTHLKTAAACLMGLAVLLLLAGWFFPELWRPAYADQRPVGFLLLGIGALLMWLHARRQAEQQVREALSSLTHSTLMHYEFAPVTLPMDEPPEAEADDGRARVAGNDDASAEAPLPAPIPFEPAAAGAPPPWSAGLLRALEWRHFEALCEEIFKQDGYVTRQEPRGAAGGDYLWLHSRLDLHQPVRIVQCRNWSGEPVGVAAVREFLGAMVDAGLKSGAFMTCGAFTAEAEALARRHGIMAVSGPDLLALVDKRPEALRRELLEIATQGDYQRPTCPRCGRKMLATPSTSAADPSALTHWVCENAPRCQGSLDWNPGPA